MFVTCQIVISPVLVGLFNVPQLMPENFDVLFFSCCTFNVVPRCNQSPAASEQLPVVANVLLWGL